MSALPELEVAMYQTPGIDFLHYTRICWGLTFFEPDPVSISLADGPDPDDFCRECARSHRAAAKALRSTVAGVPDEDSLSVTPGSVLIDFLPDLYVPGLSDVVNRFEPSRYKPMMHHDARRAQVHLVPEWVAKWASSYDDATSPRLISGGSHYEVAHFDAPSALHRDVFAGTWDIGVRTFSPEGMPPGATLLARRLVERGVTLPLFDMAFQLYIESCLAQGPLTSIVDALDHVDALAD